MKHDTTLLGRAIRGASNAAWFSWQLPQNLLGLAFWQAMKAKHNTVRVLESGQELDSRAPTPPRPLPSDYTMIQLPLPLFGGLSLGRYLFLGTPAKSPSDSQPSANLIAHERGHMIQSRRLGPLYLLAVGVPSVARAIYHRKRHSHWSAEARSEWYHRHWPESAADRHGGVIRNYTQTRAKKITEA